MALFAFRTDDSPIVNEWYAETLERSKQDNFIKNPFKWRWKKFRKKKQLLMVCEASPVYFNFSVYGWITAIAILVIWGMNWAVWMFLGLGCLGFFWTASFFYLMSLLALRKKKYEGSFKRVGLREVIKEVVL